MTLDSWDHVPPFRSHTSVHVPRDESLKLPLSAQHLLDLPSSCIVHTKVFVVVLVTVALVFTLNFFFNFCYCFDRTNCFVLELEGVPWKHQPGEGRFS